MLTRLFIRGRYIVYSAGIVGIYTSEVNAVVYYNILVIPALIDYSDSVTPISWTRRLAVADVGWPTDYRSDHVVSYKRHTEKA